MIPARGASERTQPLTMPSQTEETGVRIQESGGMNGRQGAGQKRARALVARTLLSSDSCLLSPRSVEQRLLDRGVTPGVLARGDAHRLREAAVRLQRLAVLAVAGRERRGAHQQAPTGGVGVAPEVLQLDQADLLVVGVVPELAAPERDGADQRLGVVAGLQVRLGQPERVVRPQRNQRIVQLLEDLALRPAAGAARRPDRARAVAGERLLALVDLVDERAGYEQQLGHVRVVEPIVE